MYSADSYDNLGWAAFIAGGSMAAIPAIAEPRFLPDAATMLPIDLPGHPAGQWALGNANTGYIVYCEAAGAVSLDLSGTNGSFTVKWINPRDGSTGKNEAKISGGKTVSINNTQPGPAVLWITKN